MANLKKVKNLLKIKAKKQEKQQTSATKLGPVKAKAKAKAKVKRSRRRNKTEVALYYCSVYLRLIVLVGLAFSATLTGAE